MWVSQTFKISLVKYQEKSSVDLGDTQQLVDTFVKNKYDDLVGDQETIVAGTEATDAPKYSADNLYPVFEQDATRKYMSVEGIDFVVLFIENFGKNMRFVRNFEFSANMLR